MDKKKLLIIFSALLLHGALWNPQYLFWGSFLWLLPLFYSALTSPRSPSFAQGFLWGLVFFFFHLFPVTLIFLYHAHGVGRLVGPIFIVCYGALHTAVWFWLARTTAFLLDDSIKARALAWFFWSYCYIVWVPAGILWISGRYIGSPFSLPLFPLTQYPQLLWLLSTLGRHILVLLLIGFSMCASLLLVTRNIWYAILLAACLIPFLAGFFVQQTKEDLPEHFKKIGYVQPPNSERFSHPMDAAQELYYRMCKLLKKYPDVTSIVMPELSYRFPLNEHKHVISMWNNNILHDEVQIFIGACRSEGKKFYNSLYWIKEGRVKQCYDKSQLMPLTEYVPSWCKKIPFVSTVFLEKNEFSAASNVGQVFVLDNDVVLEPTICAELFFDKKLKGSDNAVILSILNDSLLPHPFQNLILLWNIFKALEHNQFRLHVGYQRAFFITPNGQLLPLKHLNS